ncbi:heparinase II/III family protein [Bacillus sp. FJAT-49732]|uniref:Heparinase II/III family protein n=1 Tax=Lederbergia citrisecunda TaxID=2833583 RepID=A0A942TNM1_9BACI|nr:heparinase II/III family protein [Lederbergia citrisecunda]MBS4200633.1 heparinase II/III family protein [Lederbergia citrisecunda]
MIFKRSKANKNTLDNAEKILRNELFVHSAWPTVKIGKVTWKEDPYNDITWCFYLHSLDIVGYLMLAYEINPNKEYLEKAKYFIGSWVKTNPTKKDQVSPFAWKDHSVANRVVNIIHFWQHYKDSDIYDESFANLIIRTLIKHGDYLEDDRHHTFINNHGIFQDRSLIELAVLFPDLPNSEKWYEKAINRFMVHVKKDVSPSGVHLEHSGAYHIVVMNLFRSINDFLKFHNKETTKLSDLIIKMEDYLAYLVKPDGKIPITGDSGPDGITYLNEDIISNPKLLYTRTKGRSGIQPYDDIVYTDAGIAIFRSNWSFNDRQLYLKFIAGFHSRTHKHADDLSVLLSIGKTDFLVDSGKYNYQEKNPYRRYFRSTMAHNTVTVNRKSYEIEDEQVGKSKIISFSYNEEYSHVSGIHTLYPGVKIKRTILYLKQSEAVLIFDEITSLKLRTYSQIFNIGKDVNTSKITKKNILLDSILDGKTIELIQLNHVTEFKQYKGNDEPIFGWQSSVFNKKYPITQIQFSNKGTDLEYRTIINTNIDNGIKYFSTKKIKGKTTFTITNKNNERLKITI